MAAATLPRATEVKAIEDWMVEGTRHRKSSPVHSCGVSRYGTRLCAARPRTGKRTNVQASTVVWSRQWRSPSIASRVDSRTPYRKKSSATAAVDAPPATWAPTPLAGSRAASSTVPSSAAM